MAKSNSFNKREIEKNKQQKRKEKQLRREMRKGEPKDSFENMIAYVDAHGRISDTPVEPSDIEEIELDDITISTPQKAERAELVMKGRVEFFNDEKGFGFIKHSESLNKYFFHISNAPDSITIGNKVTFELERGQKGMNAINIVFINKG